MQKKRSQNVKNIKYHAKILLTLLIALGNWIRYTFFIPKTEEKSSGVWEVPTAWRRYGMFPVNRQEKHIF